MSFTFFWLLLLLMVVGIPIAFALMSAPGLSLFFDGQASMFPMLLMRMYNGMDSFPLMAIPYFILAGEVMNKGGITSTTMLSAQSFSKEALKTVKRGNISQDKFAELKQLYKSEQLSSRTLQQATLLEGSIRNTGTHACGVIITPSDISDFVPITRSKDSDFFVKQFDNSVVEDAGLLKMDFLGLKTLTIIKDTVKLIKY